MRDRLIELIDEKQVYGIDIHQPESHNTYLLDNDELADHLLEKGVIVPPLWVGQTVYHYNHHLGGVFAYLIDNIGIGSLGKSGIYWGFEANCHDEETDELLDELDFDLDYIGKTVFLTREEADKALEQATSGA